MFTMRIRQEKVKHLKILNNMFPDLKSIWIFFYAEKNTFIMQLTERILCFSILHDFTGTLCPAPENIDKNHQKS